MNTSVQHELDEKRSHFSLYKGTGVGYLTSNRKAAYLLGMYCSRDTSNGLQRKGANVISLIDTQNYYTQLTS